MSDFIRQRAWTCRILKKSQQLVESHAARIQAVSRDYPSAQKILLDLEEILTRHLGSQDRQFYEQEVRSSGNEMSSSMIDFFLEDANRLKIDSMEFFQRFPSNAGLIRIRNFPIEFQAFSRVIFERLQIEREMILMGCFCPERVRSRRKSYFNK